MFVRLSTGLQIKQQLHTSNPAASILGIRPSDSGNADLFACLSGGSYLLRGTESETRNDDGWNLPYAPENQGGENNGIVLEQEGTFKTAASQNRRGQSQWERVRT
jgi:hypothetical protein